MKKSIFTVLFISLMILSSAALSENIRLNDFQLTIRSNTYSFPMTVKEAELAGLTIRADQLPAAGYNITDVPISTGRVLFKARISAIINANGETEHWIDGIDIGKSRNPLKLSLSFGDDNRDAATGSTLIGRFVIGETKWADALNASDKWKTDGKILHNYDSVSIQNLLLNIRSDDFMHEEPKLSEIALTFDGEGDDAILIGAIINTSIVQRYGYAFSSMISDENIAQNEIDAANLSFTQFILDGKLYETGLSLSTYIDNGWFLEQGFVGNMLEPRDPNSSIVTVYPVWLYNGESLVNAGVYNPDTKSSRAIENCSVAYIYSNTMNATPLELADGIKLGDGRKAVEAVFGSAYTEAYSNNGHYLAYTNVGGASYTFYLENDFVKGIKIK